MSKNNQLSFDVDDSKYIEAINVHPEYSEKKIQRENMFGQKSYFEEKSLQNGFGYGKFSYRGNDYFVGEFPDKKMFADILGQLKKINKKCGIIVSMSEYRYSEPEGNIPRVLPEEGKTIVISESKPMITINTGKLDELQDYNLITLNMNIDASDYTLYILEAKSWPDKTRINMQGFTKYVQAVYYMRSVFKTGALYIHCSMGVGRSVTTLLGLVLYNEAVKGILPEKRMISTLSRMIKKMRTVRMNSVTVDNIQMLINFYRQLIQNPPAKWQPTPELSGK